MTVSTKDRLLGFGFFILVLIILNIAYTALINISVSEEKTRYRYIAINEANFMTSCIDKVVVRTYTIREMIMEHDGDTEFFDKVAENIYQSVKEDTNVTLKNIAVAPDGVVEKVFPLYGNASLIGFNFTDETRPGNKEAMDSYQKEKTIITNPFNLVQGGIGMATRTPVIIKNEKFDFLWGIVTATMDFEDILNAFNLSAFDKMNINYRLWYTNDNGEKVVIAENCANMDSAVSETINIYNLKWHLDILPEKGWHNENMNSLARLIIAMISALIAALVLLMLRIKRDGMLMRTLAQQDSLTHCYSRHYLNSELLDIKNGNWKNPENNYSVAIVDVDKFKQINDTYGHTAGDRALISISQILRESLDNPRKDRVVRFGGDEFLLFYSNAEKKDLRIKFQSILSSIEKVKFNDIPELKLGVSIGVALPDLSESPSYKDMMKHADDNLYKVKENGRNNYCLE